MEAKWNFPLYDWGRKRTFFLGRNVNRIEDAFLEIFAANQRPSPCLNSYKSKMPLFPNNPANFHSLLQILSLRQILTQRNGSYQANRP